MSDAHPATEKRLYAVCATLGRRVSVKVEAECEHEAKRLGLALLELGPNEGIHTVKVYTDEGVEVTP